EYGLPPKRLRPDASVMVQGYAWPGKGRDLANILEGAAVLSDGASVTGADLAIPEASLPRMGSQPSGAVDQSLREAVGDFERSRLLTALEAGGGNLSSGGALTRNTLHT